MDLFIENLNFKYGLMLWEERFNIIKEVEEKGSAKLLVDTGFGNHHFIDVNASFLVGWHAFRYRFDQC